MTRLPTKEKRRLDSLIADLETKPSKRKVGYLCKETLRIYHEYHDRAYLDLISNITWQYEYLYE